MIRADLYIIFIMSILWAWADSIWDEDKGASVVVGEGVSREREGEGRMGRGMELSTRMERKEVRK